MDNLEQALEFANYQSTINQQRQLLKQRFQDACVLAYNGGLFQLDLAFVAALKTSSFEYVLDMNGNPVKIINWEDFTNQADHTYQQATTEYGQAYQELKTKRSVKSLVGL
jgi:hypothetical protein